MKFVSGTGNVSRYKRVVEKGKQTIRVQCNSIGSDCTSYWSKLYIHIPKERKNTRGVQGKIRLSMRVLESNFVLFFVVTGERHLGPSLNRDSQWETLYRIIEVGMDGPLQYRVGI